MVRKRFGWVLLAWIAALAWQGAWRQTAHAQQPGAGPPAVGVVQAGKREITEKSEFIGRVQSIDRVDLTARVTAFVQQRLFVEGTEVQRGDLLYQLERPPFEAVVQQQAAAVAQAQAMLNNANLTLSRAEALLHTPAGQQSNVDNARAQQLSQQAQLMSAQAQLRQAEINLGYTEIRAPIAGKIGRTNFSVGNVVSPSSGPLTTIFSQDAIYVLFPIAVRTAIELEKRYADKGGINAVVLRLRLPDGTLYGQQGQIDYVEPTIAANTDTIIVRGKIANPKHHETGPGEPTDRWLTDGEFVTAIVEGVQPVQVLGIPRAAVLSDQQGNYVFVVNAQNHAEQRRIQLGQSTPETAVVTAGLKEGETVIVDGLQRVRPGIEVQPGPATPPASSAARAQAAAAEATTATNPSPVSGSPPAGTSTTGSTSGSGAGR